MARTKRHVEGYIFKAEGHKVKITWLSTNSMQDWSGLKIWEKLSCIVSEYWPGQDLDRKGHHYFQVNCHNVKVKCEKLK